MLAVERYLPEVDYLLFAEADTYPVDNRRSVEKQVRVAKRRNMRRANTCIQTPSLRVLSFGVC